MTTYDPFAPPPADRYPSLYSGDERIAAIRAARCYEPAADPVSVPQSRRRPSVLLAAAVLLVAAFSVAAIDVWLDSHLSASACAVPAAYTTSGG